MTTPLTDAKEKELLRYDDLNSHDQFELITQHARDLETKLTQTKAHLDGCLASGGFAYFSGRIEELERRMCNAEYVARNAQEKTREAEASLYRLQDALHHIKHEIGQIDLGALDTKAGRIVGEIQETINQIKKEDLG
jgi:hypothetical protein